MMMAAEKKIACVTSVAAMQMIARICRSGRPGCARVRRCRVPRHALGEMAEDVLDHDHGGVDDQAEVDRADRQQVGRLAAQEHDQHREEKRERNGRRDNDRAAQVAQKQPLNRKMSAMPEPCCAARCAWSRRLDRVRS